MVRISFGYCKYSQFSPKCAVASCVFLYVNLCVGNTHPSQKQKQMALKAICFAKFGGLKLIRSEDKIRARGDTSLAQGIARAIDINIHATAISKVSNRLGDVSTTGQRLVVFV